MIREIDPRSLRRIALLVLRARQDCDGCCPELQDIASIIERMKRNVALGSPLGPRDLRRMTSLIGGLGRDGCLPYGTIDELRELVGLRGQVSS